MAKTKNEIDIARNEEDIATVRQILELGDKSAFSILQKKYKTVISSLIRRMIKDEDDVDDLTQETFIKAYNALSTYRFEYAFSSWIYRIASNNCIDFLRKKRFPTISISKPLDCGDEDLYLEIEDSSSIPDMQVLSDEKQKIMNDAIDALPENYRKIIIMRHYEDLDYNEISDKLSLPLGTVKAHLFRARKILMIDLKKHLHILKD